MDVFTITKPAIIQLPIVFSIPHAGTYIPDDIKGELKQEKLLPDDTDWFVDKLYDFASSLGISTIKANYSRWIIDLNRNPDDTPLYNDGRVITALCTATDFLGESIYNDERKAVSKEETARRRSFYFDSYHQALQQLLDETKQQFGGVLLWDCHSIRRHVPSIYAKPFPDLILGSADGASATQNVIELALELLSNSNYFLSHNHPFKGGYITRHFGKPNEQQHALQLEMVKTLYMDDAEQLYDEHRADNIKALLVKTISVLGAACYKTLHANFLHKK